MKQAGAKAPAAPRKARDRWQQQFRAFAVRAALAEQELEHVRQRLSIIERFVRHDVRTPLTVILGHAQMIAEGLVPPSRLHESSEVMQRQSERLSSVLEELATVPPEVAHGFPVWVPCLPARAAEVSAALHGLPVIVCDADVANALRDSGEPVVSASVGVMALDALREAVVTAVSAQLRDSAQLD